MKKKLLLLLLIPNLVMAEDKLSAVGGSVSTFYSSPTQENFGVKIFEILYYDGLKNIDDYCSLKVTTLSNINCEDPIYNKMFVFNDYTDSTDFAKCTATKIEKDVWKVSYAQGNPDIYNSFIKQYNFIFNNRNLTSFNGFDKFYDTQTKREKLTNYKPLSGEKEPFVYYPLKCDSIRLPALQY